MKKLLLLTLVVSLLINSFVTINTNAVSKEGFLIIVSNALLSDPDNGDELQLAINQYKTDLESKWNPTQVNVNNVQDGTADAICSTPSTLRYLIRVYKNMGYTGFVLIGSHPSIQTAWFRDGNNTITNQDDKYYADPLDIYYADMDTNWTVNGNLITPPIKSTSIVNGKVIYEYEYSTVGPEMFFSRIYARGAVVRQPDNTYDTINSNFKENREIIRYLNKVHSYRNGTGSQLSDVEENSYFVQGTVDDKNGLNNFLDQQFKNVMVNYDPSRGNDDYFFDTLTNKGFKAIYINGHGGITDNDYADVLMNGKLISSLYFRSDRIRKLNTKARLVLLTPCSSSRYISYNQTTNGTDEDCLGKAYLFNSDYVLNIFGVTSSSNQFYPDYYPAVFNDAANFCVGKAAKNYLNRTVGGYTMQATVFGDPTIIYPAKTETSSIPVVLSYLKNVEVKAGSTAILPIQIKDPDSSNVTVEISGLPGSDVTGNVNITNSTGVYDLSITAPTDAAAKYYNVKVKLSDSQNNSYEETFKLYVSPFENGMLLNSTSGWTIDGNGQISFDSTVPPITRTQTTPEPKPCNISLNNGYATLSQALTLEPNRDYKLIYYGLKTVTMAGIANVSVADESSNIESYTSFDNFWGKDKYISFNSGYSGKVTVKVQIGSETAPVTGNVVLSGFRLVPLEWNMFNFSGEASTSFWNYGSFNWTYEKGELSCYSGNGVKALLNNQYYKNVSVEGDVTILDDTSGTSAGLVLRATELGTGYTVSISSSDNTVILKRNGINSYEEVPHSINIEPGTRYHLKVEAIENVIKVYVNDMNNPLIVLPDAYAEREQLLVSGQVGFVNYGAHAHFDNIEINGVSAPLYWDDFLTDTSGVIPERLGTVPGESSTSWTVNNFKLNAVAGEGIKAIIKKEGSSDFDTFKDFVLRSKINIANENTYSGAGLIFRASNISAGADMFTGYQVSIDAFNNAIHLCKFKNNCRFMETYNMDVQAGVDYDIKVEAIGNNIKVYVNNMITPVIDYTDNEADNSDYLQGAAGFRTYRTDVTYDDVTITGK